MYLYLDSLPLRQVYMCLRVVTHLVRLFRFAGCDVEKFLFKEVGVQVAMRRDGRGKPGCLDCRMLITRGPPEVDQAKAGVRDAEINRLPTAGLARRGSSAGRP